MTRRSFLPAMAGSGLTLTAGSTGSAAALKGRLKQAATRGCFGRKIPLEDACREAARLGLKGIDLVGPKDFPILKKYGLVPTMVPGGAEALERVVTGRAGCARIAAT